MPVKRVVDVEEAVGMVLPHDVTEIVPGEKKGPAFKKGHVIRDEDIVHLKRLGKNHIYVIQIDPDELHEDQAALKMARAISGPGIIYDPNPSEGKIGYKADIPGLFRVDRQRLYSFNLLGKVMLATLHDNTPVRKGELVAAGRAIPLVVERQIVDEAVKIASQGDGLIRVVPWTRTRAAIVVTGQEVYEGRIKDAFGPKMEEKLLSYGLEIVYKAITPDDVQVIADRIHEAIGAGAQMVLCTGGMSVDPDDVTRLAIERAGAIDIVYGSPVLPGAMFLVAGLGDVVVLGIPACGMFFKTTVLDLVLPRIIAGEKVGREQIAELGHGGLCLGCKSCNFPICPFGKG